MSVEMKATTTSRVLPPTDKEPALPSSQDIAIEIAETGGSAASKTRIERYVTLIALYTTIFIAALDQTITSIAVPTICSDLNSSAGYVWVAGAYLLANAATGPLWANCSDIWGRKVVLQISILGFAVGSIIAATSTSMAMLISGRAIQGVASGGMMVLVTVIISELFSIRKRSQYLGYIGFAWALAGSAGPLIGGTFTQFSTWRWCFWVNLPISGIVYGMLQMFLHVHNPKTKLTTGLLAIDWAGTVSILAIALLLLLGLDLGGAIYPWSSPKVICLLVFGFLSIGFFVISEKHLARYPLISLNVFKSISNTAIFIITFAHGIILIGMEFYLPLFFQSVYQASPFHSGLYCLPLVVTTATLEVLSGYLISRTGRYRELIWAAVFIMPIGTGVFISAGAPTPLAMLLGLEVVAGLGVALLFQAPIVAIQNSGNGTETAAKTAALSFIRNIGMSLSVVLGGVVFQNGMETWQSVFAEAGFNQTQLGALSGSQVAAHVDLNGLVETDSQRQLVLEAFSWSFRNVFITYTAVGGLAMAASVFLKHKKLGTHHAEARTGIEQLSRPSID